MRKTPQLLRVVSVLGLTCGLLFDGHVVEAACNAIPEASSATRFRGAAGWINSPYFSPGDEAEVGPMCNSDDLGSISTAADFVVVVVYGENSATRRAAVLAESCVQQTIDNLKAKLSGGEANCEDSATVTGLTAPAPGSEPRSLGFKFPSSDALELPDADGIGLVGQATVVTLKAAEFNDNTPPGNTPLLAALAQADCGVISKKKGVLTCADDLFTSDPRCGTTHKDKHETFPRFTALPAPNDYKAVCHLDLDDDATEDCQATAASLNFAVDADGNLLVPMNWSNVLRSISDSGGATVGYRKRYVRGSTTLPKTSTPGSGRIEIPGEEFLSSWPPVGGTWTTPPEFRAIRVPKRPDELTLFGTIDQPRSVLRIARRLRATHVCQGGTTEGSACRPGRRECACAADVEECCVPAKNRSYFQCVGGAYDSLPCTGRSQCPGGTCSPDSQTSPRAVFDLTGVPRRLGLTPVTGGVHGVCISGPNKDMTCNDASACGATDKCVTFRAEAGWLY
jgi:hypothetical protein